MSESQLFAAKPPRLRRTWSLAAIVLLLVFLVGGQMLGVIPGIALGWVDPVALQAGEMSWQAFRYILIFAFAATSLLVFLWVWFFENRSLASIGLNANFLSRFLRGYGAGLGFLTAVVGIIWALGGYEIESAGNLAMSSLIPVAWLLAGFVIQGSTEEIAFRGWFMSLIASRHGLVLAIILNSALFGLVHGMNIEMSKELVFGLVNIVLVGVFLSVYAAKEGSLWGVCGWHASWNWLLGTGFGLPVSGQDTVVDPFLVDLVDSPDAQWWLTGGVFGPEASAVTSLILVAGTIFVLMRGKFSNFEG